MEATIKLSDLPVGKDITDYTTTTTVLASMGREVCISS
jgi:hypothetical protein